MSAIILMIRKNGILKVSHFFVNGCNSNNKLLIDNIENFDKKILLILEPNKKINFKIIDYEKNDYITLKIKKSSQSLNTETNNNEYKKNVIIQEFKKKYLIDDITPFSLKFGTIIQVI